MKPPEICESFHCPTPTCNRDMLHVLKWREQRAAWTHVQGKSRRVWVCMTCGEENVGVEVSE